MRPIVGGHETLFFDAECRHRQANGYVWTFVAPDEHGDHDVAYIFAGELAKQPPVAH